MATGSKLPDKHRDDMHPDLGESVLHRRILEQFELWVGPYVLRVRTIATRVTCRFSGFSKISYRSVLLSIFSEKMECAISARAVYTQTEFAFLVCIST